MKDIEEMTMEEFCINFMGMSKKAFDKMNEGMDGLGPLEEDDGE